MVVGVRELTGRETQLMRGVLDMCVLALLDQGPRHAYGIVQSLQAYGFANASYGSIYPLVTRLRKQGLVNQTLEASPTGPARNTLGINGAGRAALGVWSEQWHQTTAITRSVLDADLAHGRPEHAGQ